MSTLSTGKIDLKRRTVGKGGRHCGNIKTRSTTVRNEILEHSDVYFLDIFGMETTLVGEDVKPPPTNGSKCTPKTGLKGCRRWLQF
jgi:hypothetical protein